MLPEERLNDIAAREIALLEAEGIRPTAEEVVKLNALGWAIERPCSRRLLARGVPVAVGGATLWPLTMYASEWLERVGSGFSGNTATFALAYAMAHGRSEGGELDVDGREAETAVKRWAKRIKCRSAELIEAIEQVLEQDSKPDLPLDPDGKSMSVGDFSAFLAATCGGDPEFWERRCAAAYSFAVLNAVVRQNRADGAPVANDPRIIATRAFGIAVEQIRERAKAAANG